MSRWPDDAVLYGLAERVGALLKRHGDYLTMAESCTGGWLAKSVTDVAGSSDWFAQGFVTYSNAAKHELLGVLAQTLQEHGAVSAETVREMAAGALCRSPAQIAVAVSGIAGPGGGSSDKPVGTVWFAWQRRGGVPVAQCEHFAGDRDAVRRQAVAMALAGIIGMYTARGYKLRFLPSP